MKKLTICTRRADNIPENEGVETIVITEKQIGKCRGCLACRRVKKCITYMDDAHVCIPLLNEAEHWDIFFQPESTIQRLLDRVLYALDGTGKTFTFHVEDDKETDYVRRLLVWAKYKEIQ